jgi:hypothetical protein
MPFSLEEARALVPQVKVATAKAVGEVDGLVREANALPETDPEREAIGERIRGIIEAWAKAMNALGADVKGLWLVDFDSGDGYWCWRHPEESLEYFHGYEEGFAGRRLIEPEVLH